METEIQPYRIQLLHGMLLTTKDLIHFGLITMDNF